LSFEINTLLTILDFKKLNKKIDSLDLDLIISAATGKPREFVLAHPEFSINGSQGAKINNSAKRRSNGEPLAYILGHREFFGLDFAVNKHTLVPRPETEMIVGKVLQLKPKNKTLIDVGTGSGNIIISLAKNIKDKNDYVAIDISKNALRVAQKNAFANKVDKKIKFLHGNLLEPIIKNESFVIRHSLASLNLWRSGSFVILANLPYLSSKIYSEAPLDVKKYEPKSALYSKNNGLNHYERLFKQVKLVISHQSSVIIFLEFSPEQKNNTHKLIKKYFPKAKPVFHKDLAGKWRICEVKV